MKIKKMTRNFFKERVFNEKEFTHIHLIFLIYNLKEKKFSKKFLIGRNSFDSFLKYKLPKQYIAIHFRHSKKGRMNEFSKNISSKIFI